MDRQRVWRDINYRWEQLQESAPEGYRAVVLVYLAGSDVPVVPAHVETSRLPDNPWIVLHATSVSDEPSETRPPDEYLVHVHESLIARVETLYLPKDDPKVERHPIGFGVGEVAEPPESDAEADQVETAEPPVLPITPRDVSVERDT